MKDWFRALKQSGQARFYEPSDWQTARLLAEVMSQELNTQTSPLPLRRHQRRRGTVKLGKHRRFNALAIVELLAHNLGQ